jgi:ADP-ribosyl-[dinitrogen reductase] hydrolase
MRLAAAQVCYCDLFPDRIGDLVERDAKSSLRTHASPQCLSACMYLTVAMCGLIDGRSREEVLDPTCEPMRLAREITLFNWEVADASDGSFRWSSLLRLSARATS